MIQGVRKSSCRLGAGKILPREAEPVRVFAPARFAFEMRFYQDPDSAGRTD